jgi:GMP synthase (glutamine-hydrolysing)
MIINDKGEQEPFQVFAATSSENILTKDVTGLVDGKRTYMTPLLVKGDWDFEKLTAKASKLTDHARVFFELGGNREGKYDVVIRSINSIDARTASVTNLPFELLVELKEKLLKIPETKNIYVDVTPKPPATIEYV